MHRVCTHFAFIWGLRISEQNISKNTCASQQNTFQNRRVYWPEESEETVNSSAFSAPYSCYHLSKWCLYLLCLWETSSWSKADFRSMYGFSPGVPTYCARTWRLWGDPALGYMKAIWPLPSTGCQEVLAPCSQLFLGSNPMSFVAESSVTTSIRSHLFLCQSAHLWLFHLETLTETMEWSRYKGNLQHGQYRLKVTVSFTWRIKVDIFGPRDALALYYTNHQPFPGSLVEGRGMWGFGAGSTVSIWRKVGSGWQGKDPIRKYS